MKNKHYCTVKLDYDRKIITKSNDVRIYRGATLITPGEWTDGYSQSSITYTHGALMEGANNWVQNFLNVDHSWSAKDLIGSVQNTRWEDNAVKGDLYIDPNLTLGRDIITNIDAGRLTSLSVEMQTDDYWDTKEQKTFATGIEFIGLAVIYGNLGACSDAKI